MGSPNDDEAVTNEWNLPSLLATIYPLGLIRKLPGIWGSLVGLPVAYAIAQYANASGRFSLIVLLLSVFALGLLAWWSIDRTGSLWGRYTDDRIVIDNVLGQVITSCFFRFDALHLIAGFVLFRLFDSLRPGPIAWVEGKLPGAYGTLLDDALAGLFAALTLAALSSLARLSL